MRFTLWKKSSFKPFDFDLWTWPGIFFVTSQASIHAQCTCYGAIWAQSVGEWKCCALHRLKNRVMGPFEPELWPWPGIFFLLWQAVVDAHLLVQGWQWVDKWKRCEVHHLKSRVFDPFDLNFWRRPGISFVLSHARVNAHLLVQFGRNRSVNEKLVRYTV